MPYVLDASLALAWCFRDEATPESAQLLLEAQSGDRFYVPAHWPAEILNALNRAVRRGRLDNASVDAYLGLLPALNIVVDEQSPASWWAETVEIIRTYPLSAYDAAYLTLALRLDIPLATLDDQLRTAAIIAGAQTFPNQKKG